MWLENYAKGQQFEFEVGDKIFSCELRKLTCANGMLYAIPNENMNDRTMKISSKMSASECQFYSKMKRLYALPKSQSENEKISEIEKKNVDEEIKIFFTFVIVWYIISTK